MSQHNEDNAYDLDKLSDPKYEGVMGEPRFATKQKEAKESKKQKELDRMRKQFQNLSNHERRQLIQTLIEEV